MRYKPNLQRRMWLGTVWPNHVGFENTDDLEEVLEQYSRWWMSLVDHPNVDFARGQIELSDTGNYHISGRAHDGFEAVVLDGQEPISSLGACEIVGRSDQLLSEDREPGGEIAGLRNCTSIFSRPHT